jgi:hypothetical protein
MPRVKKPRSLTLGKTGEGAPDAELSAEVGDAQVGFGVLLDLPAPPIEPRRVVGVRSHTASMLLGIETASREPLFVALKTKYSEPHRTPNRKN